MEVSLRCLNLMRPEKKKLRPVPWEWGVGEARLRAKVNHLMWLKGKSSGPTKSPNKSESGMCSILVAEGFFGGERVVVIVVVVLKEAFLQRCVETQRL